MTHEDGAATAANGDTPKGVVGSVRHAFDPVVSAWMTVVRAFSWVTARVVVIVLFVVAFVPYALMMRLVGFDPLDRETEPASESYWSDVEATNTALEEFRKLY